MDQFDRGSRMRAAEETIRQRSRRAGSSRGALGGHALGDLDPAPDRRRLTMVFIGMVILLAIVLAVASNARPPLEQPQPPVGVHVEAASRHQGSTTVQPPAWLPQGKRCLDVSGDRWQRDQTDCRVRRLGGDPLGGGRP